jgi:hypothetical protein
MKNKIITRERLLLFLILLFMAGYNIYTVYSRPRFNIRDDTGLFWTESAMQQRSAALMASQGYLPVSDKKAQYPEGLKYKERLCTVMEFTAGYVYRIFIPKNVPFHFYLIIFISLWSSLSVMPLYLLIHLLTKNKLSALLGALFYALTPAVHTTVTAPAFELQDFTLPLIFMHLYFFIRATRSNGHAKYSYALLSGAFLSIALSAWHLTQFYYALFVLFIGVIFFYRLNTDLRPFLVITATSFLIGIIDPVMQTAGFIYSFAMLLSYSIIISKILPVKRGVIKRSSLLVLLCGTIILTVFIATAKIQEYRFVYGLMLEKIRYLGARPRDPSRLSWETLVMWVSPFTSPSIKEIAYFTGTLLIVGIFGAVNNTRELFHRSLSFSRTILLFFTAVFLPLYLLLIRLDVFFVWFLAVQAGYAFNTAKKGVRFLLMLCILINGYLLFNQPAKVLGPEHNYLLGLIKYIRNRTPHDAAVLTSFAYGPSVLTYANRPIILHPKFEAQDMTSKVKRFEHKLFGPEKEFYDLCNAYKADFFVYQADMLLARGPESIRYRTHNLIIEKTCAVYKFHYHPESLEFFQLVYSNPHYRVYRIIKTAGMKSDGPSQYFRVYDEKIIDVKNLGIY